MLNSVQFIYIFSISYYLYQYFQYSFHASQKVTFESLIHICERVQNNKIRILNNFVPIRKNSLAKKKTAPYFKNIWYIRLTQIPTGQAELTTKNYFKKIKICLTFYICDQNSFMFFY